MAQNESLNNITHQDLQIKPYFSAELGDNIGSTITFITEFAEVQKEYPILFRKEPTTGEYQAVLLFGLQNNENLYLTKPEPTQQKYPGWNARYLPAAIARGPFMIGFENQLENGKEQVTPVIHVDMDHPKISTNDGINVFLERGGNSPYIEHISVVLNLIRDGMQLNKSMFDAFVKHELIDNVKIDIDLNNQDKHQISGFQTINTERLASLNGDTLEQLNKFGFLQAAYFVAASLSNIKNLIDVKNRHVDLQ